MDRGNEIQGIAISTETTAVNKTGTWRTISPVPQALIAPCREACPAANDIPRFVAALAAGRASQALEILRDETPFPGVCGRVCLRFCQAPCNRKHLDRSISIAALEVAAADWGTPRGSNLEVSAGTGKRVSVVGAGPAGLSCAYFLARLGHRVTVYDAADRPGGAMARGEKPYDRLPGRVLDREIGLILALGVTFRPDRALGAALSLEDLKTSDTVYLALPRAETGRFARALRPLDGWGLAVDREALAGRPMLAGAEAPVKRWFASHAVGAGKEAALAIDLILRESVQDPGACRVGPQGGMSFGAYRMDDQARAGGGRATYDRLNAETLHWVPETHRIRVAGDDRAPEISQRGRRSYSLPEAADEARRCLSCGTCNLCGLCTQLCPELAVSLGRETAVFNYDYCKGCGICIQECPRGAVGWVTLRSGVR